MPRFQIGWYNGWSPQERLATLPRQREAIRTGAIGAIGAPVTCSICATTPEPGSNNAVGLHDEDYDALDAYHVCRRCHRTLHDRFEAPDAWLTLVDLHGDGASWFERLSMDAAALRQPFSETYPNGLPRGQSSGG